MSEKAVNHNIIGRVDGAELSPRVLSGICFLCQASLSRLSCLCDACIKDLPVNALACPACAIPVKNAGLCAACLQKNFTVNQRSICVYRYEFPVSVLVQEMKFNGRLDFAGFLGEKIADRVLNDGAILPQTIIPVPLHPRRLVRRGFNQAAVLARYISQQIGVPVDNSVCHRRKHTVPQTDLPAEERRRNIKGAFVLSGQPAGYYRHIAIVDDVVTTGSTTNEIARLFLRAGVTRVDVWACARAVI